MDQTAMTPFVKRLVIALIPRDNKDVVSPSWSDVEAALKECELRGGHLDLYDDSEGHALTIFGEGQKFHLTVSVHETTFFFYSNGAEPTGRMVDIAGHSFSGEQICYDESTAIAIAKAFYLTGERLREVPWIEETIEI